MSRVAIIGGGISGLTAAFYLEQERRRGAPLSFALYESSPRFGGVIQTERVDGCLIEGGPDSFLSTKPWARELCDDLRMSSQLIGSRDAERKTYILIDNRMEAIPPGMQMMVPTRVLPVVKSRLFSSATKVAMLKEYFFPPDPLAADADESVASFVSRHFKSEMVERLADPLLSGVYGGEAALLSARATLPQMVDSECRHRSLVRGALATMRARRSMKGTPAPMFTTLRDGMQRMVEAIMRQLPREALHASTPVRGLQQTDSGWRLTFGDSTEDFDSVILALPAHASAALLGDVNSAQRIVEILGEFSYSSAVTVALAFDERQVALPPGFGFLVPRSEGKRTMACTFVHRKFDNRAPEAVALLRIFLGGVRDPEVVNLSDDEIVATVRKELTQILGITAEPRIVRVSKWAQAMAQYEVEHLLRVARLEMHLQRLPTLQLIGNAYHGIGIPDCVRMGRFAAEEVARKLRAQHVSA